ncbi:HK97 family phage prohead protease [Lutibaculum baratangense]|uniref:Prohead protease n=1 Tax=Lutibaculum baratangense AMV1 TaxID=631454 RepID=V4R9B3_9HYPH|nr:HK97 family phage prohead protease [Lutibaculum baratangense]ESR22791.1 prohead protease [Lutibaculum baratangense AMV1]
MSGEGVERAAADALARETKRAPVALEEVTEDGTFEGYASLFGKADLSGDVIEPGAFAASLRKRGPSRIRMLWQHEPSEPIGVWISIAEDRRGLKVAGRLTPEVMRAREVLALMREGGLDGLSIGFRTIRARRDRRTGLRHLLEVDLWEISVVTFPMLDEARVGQVKRSPWARGPGDEAAIRRAAAALRRAM